MENRTLFLLAHDIWHNCGGDTIYFDDKNNEYWYAIHYDYSKWRWTSYFTFEKYVNKANYMDKNEFSSKEDAIEKCAEHWMNHRYD